MNTIENSVPAVVQQHCRIRSVVHSPARVAALDFVHLRSSLMTYIRNLSNAHELFFNQILEKSIAIEKLDNKTGQCKRVVPNTAKFPASTATVEAARSEQAGRGQLRDFREDIICTASLLYIIEFLFKVYITVL